MADKLNPIAPWSAIRVPQEPDDRLSRITAQFIDQDQGRCRPSLNSGLAMTPIRGVTCTRMSRLIIETLLLSK
jgi:hypothetical protein